MFIATEAAVASDILGAMITPVALLSGTGLFLLTTTNRLGRVVDRVRHLDKALEELRNAPDSPRRDFLVERHLKQLDILERRGLALKNALWGLHGGFSLFIASSLALALLAPFGDIRWPAVAFACAGMVLLLVAAVSLTVEVRNTFSAVQIDLEIGRTAHKRDPRPH
jgi:hypothetical protein